MAEAELLADFPGLLPEHIRAALAFARAAAGSVVERGMTRGHFRGWTSRDSKRPRFPSPRRWRIIETPREDVP